MSFPLPPEQTSMEVDTDAPAPATQPTPQRATQPVLQRPQPSVSTRRSAVARLPEQLNPLVFQIVTEQADIMRSNYKMVRAVNEGKTPEKPKDPNKRKIHDAFEDIEASLREAKRIRKLEKEVKGDAVEGLLASKLSEKGKKEGVLPAVKKLTDATLVKPYGQQMGSASTQTGDVHAINPGSKVGSGTLQLLGHLAGLFMKQTSDLEYQAVLVNGRILVCSNATTAITSFTGQSLQQLATLAVQTRVSLDAKSKKVRPYLIGSVMEALKIPRTSTAKPNDIQSDGTTMLAEFEFGHHVDHDSRKSLLSLLTILQHHALNNVAMKGPMSVEAASTCIEDDNYANSVILVKPMNEGAGWHAEQSLMMVLIQAGWVGGASVAGTKLPCLVCWHTLNLLPQFGHPVTLVQKPGLLWTNNTIKGLTYVAKALGVQNATDLQARFVRSQAYTEEEFRQYLVAVIEQADFAVTVRAGGGLKSKGLRQNQSQKSFYLAQTEQGVLSGSPYPENVPGSPGGYYNTPPNSPGLQEDNAAWAQHKMDVEEYDKKVAEQKAAEQKAAEQKAAAKEKKPSTDS
jgi:hypothetical protein